ncbi:MAG: hypothetical protein KGQ87_11030, partial [Verrucomicrobia bacterium]|nr:hypothetical protein [Verrucomicrobiota bacterium]
TRVFSHFYRPTTDSTANRAYFMAEVWNPHQPKTNASGPTRFRFAAAGESRFHVGSIEDPTKPYPTNPDPSLRGPSVAPNGQKSVRGFTLSRTSSSNPVFSPGAANSNFANPTLLLPVNGASATGNNNVSDGPVKFVGIYAARLVCKADVDDTNTWGGNGPCYGGYLVGDPTLSFELQYENGTGNWVSYQIWNGHKWGGIWDGGCNRGPGDRVSPAVYCGGMDPRSNRFGNMGNYAHFRSQTLPYWNDKSYQDSLYKTLRPDSTKTQDTVWTSLPYGVPLYVGAPVPPAGWGPNPLAPPPDGGTAYRPGWLTENKDTLPTWYKDNDGILRNGDAAYASGAWGQPLEQANSAAGLASRPVILDRPFRSVAEMGYAFRDLPYKSLDFFTENSADAALLDVFSVNESPVTGVTAGVLNPNTRHQPVLKAVLANVLKNELDAASTLDAATEADKIATKITNATAASPLRNPSDIATRIPRSLASGDFAGNDAAIKTRRESVVRALADVSNTRTWNLLIDVVAQTGSCPISSTDLSQFSVTGESHYWLHVAIDSFTGQVVDQYLEQVPTGPVAIGFNFDSTSSIEVAEKQPVGAILGTLTAANSTPSSTASYSLVSGAGDDDNSSFTIIGNNVQAAAVLNYLTKSTYTIRVRATDQIGLSFDQSLTINLLPNPYTQWTLSVAPTTNGGITGSGKYDSGTTATLTAIPAAGYAFTSWTGDVLGATNPLTITMDADKSVGATFEPDLSDADADGLTAYDEVTLYLTDPTKADSDNDGLTDAYELGIGRFSVVSGSRTWAQAKAHAETQGGTLATFANQDEWNLAMQSIGADALLDVGGLWIGATDEATEGTWRWVTGEPFVFTRWETGQPDNLNNSDYAAVAGDLGGTSGKWYDYRATTTRDGYILESGYSTNPSDADSDDDGLLDGAEMTAGTNPFVADTDADGYSDSYELSNSSNPLVASSLPTYQLTLSSGGVVTGGSFAFTGNLAHGTNATLTATPATGYVFSGWSGNASGTSNPLTLLMNGNKTVGAAFSQDSRDPDSDGLTNYQELIDHSTNPNNADSNADGLRDGLALSLGKNPNEDHSAFVTTLLAERAQLGLRTDSDYTDLRAGSMSLQRAAGSNKLEIRMKLQKSSNLLNWQDDGEAVFEKSMDPASPKLFYRFGVE